MRYVESRLVSQMERVWFPSFLRLTEISWTVVPLPKFLVGTLSFVVVFTVMRSREGRASTQCVSVRVGVAKRLSSRGFSTDLPCEAVSLVEGGPNDLRTFTQTFGNGRAEHDYCRTRANVERVVVRRSRSRRVSMGWNSTTAAGPLGTHRQGPTVDDSDRKGLVGDGSQGRRKGPPV